MLEWIEVHRHWLTALAGASMAVFVISLVVGPMIVLRIPADYFAHDQRPESWLDRRHPAIHWTLRLVKNIAAIVLLLGGLAMLALPGQGLLTLLAGFMLLDAPGKYRLEKWLIGRPWLHRPINYLRHRRGRLPLLVN
jgi:archaellum biogenesis protein FlaJ (TadC family)